MRAIRAIRPTLPAVCIRGPSADDHCDEELLGFTALFAGIEDRVNPVKVKIVCRATGVPLAVENITPDVGLPSCSR